MRFSSFGRGTKELIVSRNISGIDESDIARDQWKVRSERNPYSLLESTAIGVEHSQSAAPLTLVRVAGA
jgi:hypothetical protein